jgi:endonuclease VIII
MPEGDTIAYAARRMRPVIAGHVPDLISTPHPRFTHDRWPERLAGRAVDEIRTHGKHLLICFQGGLVIHSHLRMTGRWVIYGDTARSGRPRGGAWLVLGRGGRQVVQFGGPVLELMTAARARYDPRLVGLGPDVLAPEFDYDRFLARLRGDDQTRSIGDALIDQRNVAGIGNIWKAEGCWEAAVDPWRRVADVSGEEAARIIELLRPRMQFSAEHGRMEGEARVYRRSGRRCPRCGTAIADAQTGLRGSLAGSRTGPPAQRRPARATGADDNRTSFWCPGCQH